MVYKGHFGWVFHALEALPYQVYHKGIKLSLSVRSCNYVKHFNDFQNESHPVHRHIWHLRPLGKYFSRYIFMSPTRFRGKAYVTSYASSPTPSKGLAQFLYQSHPVSLTPLYKYIYILYNYILILNCIYLEHTVYLY